MAESSNSAMDESAPLVMDEVLQQLMQDDQEEWEYEYSTTETETYYLTLELSYPEFKGMSAKMNIHSRGGYYKNWQETTGGADPISRPSGSAAGADSRAVVAEVHVRIKDDVSSNDEAPTSTAERDEDDGDAMIDPALRRSKGKEPVRKNIDLTRASTTREPTAEPAASGDAPSHEQEPEPREDIQILELHSDHPLISYRGRLFEGEWAEVIGTEALLARHDDEHPLPALRRVGGDIDVLGALSSRIVTKEKVAKARHEEGADPLAATRAELNMQVPAGKLDRTGARKQQARFLENLIALKKIKGQTDDVTVYALDGAGKDFDDNKDPDYKPRRKRTAAAAALGMPPMRGSGGGGGRRGRGRLAAARRGRQGRVLSQPRSTPTPARWEDLEEQQGGGDEEASEAMDEYEDDDISMSMG
ncbi:Transcription factor TFIIIC, tau55-related protein [Cordyceps fumosorosea ARSEF 2679]|uniref:Transcription factor TFIIIC, tau55-related protein n=1 Tax=Cordyceps fumosorosea (strain ARSEF 2679) TaxID=1081104 RepID=A0A167XCD0_CORFA|nr:Transcription factor TFIIIC, tau55-related protein [Cordyceps fumosorosea ARSEF 2679]OAA64798.1 Transcription factor TFIIIC, tau55-related protein [Cordyceps fumosorosea ARSEF 2679]